MSRAGLCLHLAFAQRGDEGWDGLSMEGRGGTRVFCTHSRLFLSLSALNTGLNLGWSVLVLTLIGLSTSLWLGLRLLRRTNDWKRALRSIIANRVMILVSLVLYGVPGYFAHELRNKIELWSKRNASAKRSSMEP